MALAITRQELSAEELRVTARRTKDGDQARRLLAIALVVEGTSRTQAARVTGMDRQTLRDRVVRYNAEGVAGLRARPRPGSSGERRVGKECVRTGRARWSRYT